MEMAVGFFAVVGTIVGFFADEFAAGELLVDE